MNVEVLPQPDGTIWVRCADCAWHSFALPAPLGGGKARAKILAASHKCAASDFLEANK